MGITHLGFDEKFVEEIRSEEKLATLRNASGLNSTPTEGDVVDAIVSHDDGPFAKLRLTKVSSMTVEEIVNTSFDAHQDYSSVSEFNTIMKRYYPMSSPFSEDDEFIYIEFEVVNTL